VSPRRKVDTEEPDFFDAPAPKRPTRPRSRAVGWAGGVVTVLLAAAITLSTLILISHERDRRTQLRDASALGYVREFMTAYTTLDPFNANAYADRIMSQATGDFAKTFREKQNEILVQVARAEPTTGSVVEAGVQRWSDNGSADILVATKLTAKAPDGKASVESGNRWVATVTQEGQQWKISNLIQVI
jgi:Mce-associated membrane protein